MKKGIVTLIAVVSMFVLYLLFASIITSRYSKNVIVDNVKGDTVTILDENGYYWEFYGEGYTKGEKLTVVFNSNGTPSIYDDEIVKIK